MSVPPSGSRVCALAHRVRTPHGMTRTGSGIGLGTLDQTLEVK
jgi:hypothetical protein